jgi:polysaccharide biosynthesis transport protein
MLNMVRGDLSRLPISEAPQDGERQSGLGELIEFAFSLARRHWLMILFVAALGLAASLIYLRVTPPTYTAQAKVLFGHSRPQFNQQQSILADSPSGEASLESQLQILKSKSILAAVIAQRKLADDPDFQAQPPSLPTRLIRQAKNLFGAGSAEEAREPAQELDDLVAAFEDRLTIARIGLSNVIEIKYSSSNAKQAAEVANALANTYIVDQLNAKFEANRTAATWLQERLRDLGQQALTAERAVNEFRSQHNIVAADGKLMDEQRVTELNSRLIAARAQTTEALTRFNKFEATLRSSDTEAISESASREASASDALNSPIINALRQQYLEHARREAEWSARLGRGHLAVVNLRAKMRDLRNSILEEVRRLAEASRSDYEAAKQRQEDFEKQLAQAVAQSRTANSAETTLRELETNAKGYRSLYESSLQRYMGAVQQESFPITEARVISPASPPPRKSKPKTSLVLAFGLLGGLALGVALGALRDFMDRVFRTASQVEALLQIPCLSLVPLLKDVVPKPLPRELQQGGKALGQKMIARPSGVFWAATEMPLSRFAESIRSIKLAVDLNVTSPSNKVVGITSSLPNEGKSTIAAALALLTAHSGARVIVVDCDLRNPSLSRSLAPAANAGIIEVIAGEVSLKDAIWRDPKTNLAFLPTVKKKPLFHTSEMLAADSTKQLFDQLRAAYDYVIVDLPPLAPVVDVRATSRLIDCFILAVEWASTKTDIVLHALHSAPSLHSALIGAVLSKTDMQMIQRYDHYHRDYYNNEHYGRYGYTAER